MNFKFDQDQEMMRDSAKRLLADLSPLSAVHKILDSDTLTYDEKLWQQMAESGWQGTAIPEEFGGSGLGYLELAVLAEEMGRALACVPFGSSIYLAAEAIMAAGSDQQNALICPRSPVARPLRPMPMPKRAASMPRARRSRPAAASSAASSRR